MTDIEISVAELKAKRDKGEDFILLDVREPDEFETANIGGQLIPLRQLPRNLEKLDKSKEIVVHCHHGGRSMQALMYLQSQGYEHVKNLAGGIDAWSREIDSSVPRY
jgi:rhodanese-related sulfurtransferase